MAFLCREKKESEIVLKSAAFSSAEVVCIFSEEMGDAQPAKKELQNPLPSFLQLYGSKWVPIHPLITHLGIQSAHSTVVGLQLVSKTRTSVEL